MISSIKAGRYTPSPVKLVEIPKPNGGKRRLGIPTVKDRVIQQAIHQILSAIYEPTFSDHSYGFRPQRSARQALEKASKYVSEGRIYAVDIDLKNFFDEVNHDRLMHRLSLKISDKRVLKLIRKYLQSGIMTDGAVSQRREGTPQGSPLSPLLSNILLDELDKELEKRGHKFVRFADDCNILVRSQRAGDRVKQSISKLIEAKLKLKINEEKSKVSQIHQTKFLGYSIDLSGRLILAAESKTKIKEKIRKTTQRNRGKSLESILTELTLQLRGWLNYFQYAECGRTLESLDSWIRRKLRCYRIKQCKRPYSLQRFLESNGVKSWQSWIIALSGKGYWRKSASPQVQEAMSTRWFEEKGLYSLKQNYERLKNLRKPPCARACTVV